MTKHPCPYSKELLGPLRRTLETYHEGTTVLDPFAGSGEFLDTLAASGWDTVGVDLDTDWTTSPRVLRGDATRLPFADGSFAHVMTSPCYGNRLADRDMRASVACTYMKALQREASAGSACHLQWGAAYRILHIQAWAEVARVLQPGGVFILNIKDHYRGDTLQRVAAWHYEVAQALIGPPVTRGPLRVRVQSMQRGANRRRVEHEEIHVFRKAA